MWHFRLGDYVRVAGLPNSQWQNRQGTIVEVFDRYEDEENTQECAVDIGGEHRWFMATDLMKAVPPRLLRFLRAEILDRWHLDPNDVESLNGHQHSPE